MQPVKTKKKLSRADKKQIEVAIARANRTDKKGKSAQDSIPYERMWSDGICRVSDSHYTKTIQFQDINYQLSQNEDKTAIFEGWCDFLNYFDSSIHFQLSFLNLAASEETFANSISIPPQGDAFDSIREEYTTMLQNQLARGNNGLIKTKYLTFGIDADSIKAAKPRLERIETDILNNFKRLGVAARTLDGKERLSQLHAVFHMDEQLPFQFEWDWLAPSGLSTKDFIAPSSFEFRTGKQFRMGKKYGAVSFLQILAPELNDRLLADFLDMESSLIVSMHIQSVDQVKAIKTVKRKITDLDRSKIEEQKKAVRAGYDMDIIPSDLATYGSEAKKLLQDLQSRNERMFLVSFLVLNTADNPRQLGNNIFQAGSIAQKYNCQLTRLDFQQEEGLMSCLPLGLNQIEIQRGLTTSSTAIFVPFTTQELFQNGKEALYYGINALSNNLIMVDRKLLKNPNGLILGTPGSGKSFSAKREIANCFLLTSDDVIICDPEAEYAPLVERLHGQVIKISPTSTNYINPMDLNLDYSDDESPLSLKSDFILSLCELIVGGTVVRSGCMAKDADMILSEFILLGIGGKELSEENAAQTAKALNIIQPDFIRVHATGIKLESKLGEFVRDGSFTLQSEEEIVIEQKLFLQQLHEMDSYYVNEHIVNLLLEVRGNLRTEKQEMLSTIDRFLTLPPDERLLFTVGRRLNIFFRLDDLKKPKLHQKAGESLQQILSKNPHVDFAALCNYVRQSQI